MLSTIKFTAAYGDESKPVELAYLIGGYYHIYIDRFYYGQIHKRNGKWTVLLQDPASMTIDDIQILQDIVETQSATGS